MADMVFNIAKRGILDGTIDLTSDTIKIFPIISTALDDGTSEDADNVGALTFTEHDGSGYTWGFAGTGRQTLANKAFTTDDTGDEAEFDNTADITWSSLGAGASPATGFLVYKHDTNDATSIPICWLDGAFTSNGGDVTVQFNAEGILNLT